MSGASTDTAEFARRDAAIEKGFRGVTSATLVLEAIAVLLALPVAVRLDGGVGPFGVAAICLLAALLIGCCVIVKRPYAPVVILSMQVVMIAGWFITPTLGVMGLVFAAVWVLILWFRAELRRRLAAGTLPEPPQPRGP